MGSPQKRVQYRYDARGNKSVMIDPDGGRFSYSYDSTNRLTRVINPQGDRTSYSYDAGGRRTLTKLANGTRTSYAYDGASNLTKLYSLKNDGTVLSSFDYGYDKVGNRTRVVEADGSRTTWSYDNTYQLTGEYRTGITPWRDTYTYDAAGNRLVKNRGGARTTSTYDSANQLRYSQDSTGRTTYTYDADGNQLVQLDPAGTRTTNTWDYENRMTLSRMPASARSTMAYEPEGLRIKLEDATGVCKFVWDEQRYLTETNATNDTQVVYSNEPTTYGGLLSQRRATTTSWFHFDAIGSTRQVTNGTAVVTAAKLYDVWGLEMSTSGSTVFPFGHIGRLGYYTDIAGTKLYVRARYLLPKYGAWINKDPAWVATHSLAMTYADGRPLRYVDPQGLQCRDIKQSKLYDYDTANQGNYPQGRLPIATLFADLTWSGACSNSPGDYVVELVISAYGAYSYEQDRDGDGISERYFAIGCNEGTANFLRHIRDADVYDLINTEGSTDDCRIIKQYSKKGYKGCEQLTLSLLCPVPCVGGACSGDQRSTKWSMVTAGKDTGDPNHLNNHSIYLNWTLSPLQQKCCEVSSCAAHLVLAQFKPKE